MKEWRFVGFDDGFGSLSDLKAVLIGCVTAGTRVEGFLFSKITVDGDDVTSKICSMVSNSKFKEQLKCIFLSGITFAGFNTADIVRIYEDTSIPVIVVVKKRPNIESIQKALNKLESGKEKLELIRKSGTSHKILDFYVQTAGCSLDDVEDYIKSSTIRGPLPEPLRVAHLVASSIIYGESKRE